MSAMTNTVRAFAASGHRGSGVNTRTLVLGAGLTGQSVARWFAAQGAHAEFADMREDMDASVIQSILPGAAVTLGDWATMDLSAVDQIVASPGIPDHDPLLTRARAAGIPILGDVSLFCRDVQAPVIAVTGSNGKSTVVSLLAAMCAAANVPAAAGGNLGTPVLDLPFVGDTGWYVLELSSFQLQRTDNLQAYTACILNLSPDHLDWHGSMASYAAAKARIYRHCQFAVINADAGLELTEVDPAAAQVRYALAAPEAREFGVCAHDGALWIAFGDERLLRVSECGLIGRHNVSNVLAALSIGSTMDLSMTAMLEAVRAFKGLEHRHQLVASRSGVNWINDSKATNTGAALASIAAVDGPVVLLLGGRDKGEDLRAFARSLPANVRYSIAYGENRALVESALRDAGQRVLAADDLATAVQRAAAVALGGDSVLLAPAAASHDAYRDYRERGTHFAQLVNEVIV
ncbi:MAG: UDP-N-acetylmuramoyl-L-alanine--D-glutamate ligase [Pseudomonadota bacterium]